MCQKIKFMNEKLREFLARHDIYCFILSTMTESNASFTWEMEAVWGSSPSCAHVTVTLTAGPWFLALNAWECKAKAISKLRDRMEEFQTR